MKPKLLPAMLAGAIALFSLGSSAAALGTHIFVVSLDAAQEVPPNGSTGTGSCTVTLNDISGLVTVSGSYTGLGSAAIAAHLHGLAGPGMNAGILIGLAHTGGTSGTVSGSGVLSAANVTGMLNGLTYLNVHTSSIPGGEIRGQVVQQVPSLSELWVAALAVLGVAGAAWVLTRRPAPIATA